VVATRPGNLGEHDFFFWVQPRGKERRPRGRKRSAAVASHRVGAAFRRSGTRGPCVEEEADVLIVKIAGVLMREHQREGVVHADGSGKVVRELELGRLRRSCRNFPGRESFLSEPVRTVTHSVGRRPGKEEEDSVWLVGERRARPRVSRVGGRHPGIVAGLDDARLPRPGVRDHELRLSPTAWRPDRDSRGPALLLRLASRHRAVAATDSARIRAQTRGHQGQAFLRASPPPRPPSSMRLEVTVHERRYSRHRGADPSQGRDARDGRGLQEFGREGSGRRKGGTDTSKPRLRHPLRE